MQKFETFFQAPKAAWTALQTVFGTSILFAFKSERNRLRIQINTQFILSTSLTPKSYMIATSSIHVFLWHNFHSLHYIWYLYMEKILDYTIEYFAVHLYKCIFLPRYVSNSQANPKQHWAHLKKLFTQSPPLICVSCHIQKFPSYIPL